MENEEVVKKFYRNFIKKDCKEVQLNFRELKLTEERIAKKLYGSRKNKGLNEERTSHFKGVLKNEE